eukprot:94132_1
MHHENIVRITLFVPQPFFFNFVLLVPQPNGVQMISVQYNHCNIKHPLNHNGFHHQLFIATPCVFCALSDKKHIVVGVISTVIQYRFKCNPNFVDLCSNRCQFHIIIVIPHGKLLRYYKTTTICTCLRVFVSDILHRIL